MQQRLGRQFMAIAGQGLRAEFSERERLLSPLLFAITMLVLFAFSMGEVSQEFFQKVFIAETFLTVFFALQISFSRIFEPDTQDRVFDLMRTYPISPTAWYLAKFSLVLLMGAFILFPTILVSAFLNDMIAKVLTLGPLFMINGLTLVGLTAVGVLLSALTMRASARQILFPLLYFPLTTPVLLAAIQASLAFLKDGTMTDAFWSWWGLLVGFDLIYFTLGILFYGEIVDST